MATTMPRALVHSVAAALAQRNWVSVNLQLHDAPLAYRTHDSPMAGHNLCISLDEHALRWLTSQVNLKSLGDGKGQVIDERKMLKEGH